MSTQNLIQIKRSETTKTPASLANGELAWSSNGNVLYVGDFGTVRSVGGEHITGTNEVDVSYAANGEVTIGLAANVDFSNLDANTFALSGYLVDSFTNDLNVSASNTQLVAADEIKDYVDTEIATGIASIDNINDVDTTGKAQGDVLAYDGSNWVDYNVIGDNGFNVTSNTTALSLNVDAQDGLEANSTGLFVTTGNGLTIDGNGNVAISSGDDVTFGDVAVEGDLTVTGNVVSLDITEFKVEDPLIHLGSNNVADSIDLGFIGHYSDDAGVTIEHAGLFRDADDEKFHFFRDLVDVNLDNGATTVDKTANTYARADVVLGNLEGFNATLEDVSANSLSLTNDLEVVHGGTGLSSVSNNAILYGQDTGSLAEASGSAYQVLQMNASGVPVFDSLDGGTF